MSLEKLIDNRDKIISKAENDLLGSFAQVENQIYKRVLNYLLIADLSTNKLNDTFSKIGNIINEAIEGSGYKSRVSKYLTSFDKITENVIAIQKNVNNINISKAGISKFQNFTVESTIEKMLRSGVDSNFVTPLRESLYKHLILGGSVADTEKILRKYILSEGDKLSKFQRYVTQISRDAIHQYEGSINARIAQQFKMGNYRYVGSLIKDSRAQCIKWVEMGIIPKDKLQAEIDWAIQGGLYKGKRASGMIPDTTVETFAVYRGGYNCRHHAIPTFKEK